MAGSDAAAAASVVFVAGPSGAAAATSAVAAAPEAPGGTDAGVSPRRLNCPSNAAICASRTPRRACRRAFSSTAAIATALARSPLLDKSLVRSLHGGECLPVVLNGGGGKEKRAQWPWTPSNSVQVLRGDGSGGDKVRVEPSNVGCHCGCNGLEAVAPPCRCRVLPAHAASVASLHKNLIDEWSASAPPVAAARSDSFGASVAAVLMEDASPCAASAMEVSCPSRRECRMRSFPQRTMAGDGGNLQSMPPSVSMTGTPPVPSTGQRGEQLLAVAAGTLERCRSGMMSSQKSWWLPFSENSEIRACVGGWFQEKFKRRSFVVCTTSPLTSICFFPVIRLWSSSTRVSPGSPASSTQACRSLLVHTLRPIGSHWYKALRGGGSVKLRSP
mmetsp:Transcript_46787/g.130286  ORF Transcript_46787/g.130286 Transcript_46787/m.130286 type:complete len:387 (+) Transcript_46787:1372-2532(+)